jgi:hypothetical protein
VKGIQVCSIKGPGSLKREGNQKNVMGSFKDLLLKRTIKPEKLKFT